MGGNQDHSRAAFGRYIAESVFWTPAALLPRQDVVWEKVEENVIRVTVCHRQISQSIDIQIDSDGKPISVKFMRWNNANPQKEYRIQPFGGYLADFRKVQGFRVPFDVKAINMFDTDSSFLFYKAKVKSVSYDKVV